MDLNKHAILTASKIITSTLLCLFCGCGKELPVTGSSGEVITTEFPVFFSRASNAIVEGEHLTIVVPQDIELVDSVYVDDTNNLPSEIRCESAADKELLKFHVMFRPDNAALDHVDDERFRLLHTQKRLAEPMSICIVRRSLGGNMKATRRQYSITSASIVRQKAE